MAAYEKTILCLANSRRPGGTCFAGKEFANGASSHWVRPINASNGGAISGQDRLYADHSHAELFDIVKVPLVTPKPHLHHKEDHQIDSKVFWEKTGRATWDDVLKATDKVIGELWVNEDSSFHGQNDKVSEGSAAKLGGSLNLIKPESLEVVVAWETVYQAPNVHRVRAKFKYNSIRYNFVVTDESFEQEYFLKGDGTYKIEDAHLCVSLAEVFRGSATKLVAAVITPDRI
jgi:hypothetical protein